MKCYLLLALVVALATSARAQNGVCGSTGTFSKCFDAYVADLKVDPLNCGGCHNVCAGGISCCYGQCQDCPGGSFKCANNVCTNLQTDPKNCGRCGAACPAGAQCINGACGCPADKPTSCGVCTSTLTDSNNCGACGIACQAGSTCANGQCVAVPSPSPAQQSPSPSPAQPSPSPVVPTPAPQTGSCGSTGTKSKCFDAYVADFMIDPLNCGGCHKVCAQGINCCFGQCQDCPGGSYKCKNNVCTNLQTDPQNCGICGNACPSGNQCVNGGCAPIPSPSPSPSPSPAPVNPSPSPAGGTCPTCNPGYSCKNGKCLKIVTYVKPKRNGIRIDFCLAADRTQCGQPAADAYCQHKGFDGALTFNGPINKSPTFFLGTQQTCTSNCATFHSIDCVKAQK